MTDIPCLAPLLPILPGCRLQPAMFHVIGNIKQSKKILHATLFCDWSTVFTDWCSISISTWWSQKFWHFFEATVIFCKTDIKLYQKNGITNQYYNWILTRVSSTCATLVSTLLRAAIAWKVETRWVFIGIAEVGIKSAHQLCKWSPDILPAWKHCFTLVLARLGPSQTWFSLASSKITWWMKLVTWRLDKTTLLCHMAHHKEYLLLEVTNWTVNKINSARYTMVLSEF